MSDEVDAGDPEVQGGEASQSRGGLGPPSLGAGRWTSEYSQRELLAWGRARLAGLEGSDPAQEARILLEWAMGVDSLWTAQDPVGARAAEAFRSGVARRRHRVPLQHVIGRMWFRGLTLQSRTNVFVVRPETEVVAGVAIEEALAVATSGHQPIVVDLATGSGAIALALAAEVPSARVYAVELDAHAVDLAQTNRAALEAQGTIRPGQVSIVHDDAMSALSELDGSVHVVVSNPPYIPSVDVPTQLEALHDPEMALYGGGEDGMVIPRGIVTRAVRLLVPGGLLVVEHAEVQSGPMRQIATQAGFEHVETRSDLAGHDRMLVGQSARHPRGYGGADAGSM